MFSPSGERIEFSRMGKQADVTSKRLMIMRLKNVQVGKGQYLYKSSRPIWSTKTAEQTKEGGQTAHIISQEQRKTMEQH